MTLRDFFRVLLKLIGIYFLVQILIGYLPAQLQFMTSGFEANSTTGVLVYLILILAVCYFTFYLLVRNPDKIIDWLRLDKNYDNTEINIHNFNTRNIIILGLFIIGGFLVIDNVTAVISYLYYEFKDSLSNDAHLPKSDNKIALLLASLNLILGCILIIYRNNIANYFEKK